MSAESDEDDDLAAMFHQMELDERQQREEAAIARCRPLQDELRQLIDELNRNRNT